jgi:hypothetical protein
MRAGRPLLLWAVTTLLLSFLSCGGGVVNARQQHSNLRHPIAAVSAYSRSAAGESFCPPKRSLLLTPDQGGA